nr:MAG TPA: hypothetical protein [Caudoviricetes sp.]
MFSSSFCRCCSCYRIFILPHTSGRVNKILRVIVKKFLTIAKRGDNIRLKLPEGVEKEVI